MKIHDEYPAGSYGRPFGFALEAMKMGRKVSRRSNTNAYLFMDFNNASLIYIFSDAEGCSVIWVPTQSQLLAEDWFIQNEDWFIQNEDWFIKDEDWFIQNKERKNDFA